ACVLVVALLRYPAAIERRWLLIAGLLTAEVATHVLAAAKFGRHASYHSVLSKIWGLLLASSMIALLGFGMDKDDWLLDLSIVWGILSIAQGRTTAPSLPVWQRDVPTLFHAVRLRRQLTRRSKAHRSLAPSRSWW